MDRLTAMVTEDIVAEDSAFVAGSVDLSRLRGRKMVLTGANGLLCQYLVAALSHANRQAGLDCRIHCHSRGGPSPLLQALMAEDPRIRCESGDLVERVPRLEGFDYLVHGATYGQPGRWLTEQLKTLELNTNVLRDLLEQAVGAGARVMYLSSLDIYGPMDPAAVPVSEAYRGPMDHLGARSAYGEAKRMGELLCNLYREERGLSVVAPRISHAYGPGIRADDRRVISDFIRMAMLDRRIVLQDMGDAVKSFGYVRDIALMLLQVLLNGREFVYNVGGSDRVTILELARTIADLTGGVPVELPAPGTLSSPTDARYVGLGLERYARDFGPPPQLPLREGLRRTMAWQERHIFAA